MEKLAYTQSGQTVKILEQTSLGYIGVYLMERTWNDEVDYYEGETKFFHKNELSESPEFYKLDARYKSKKEELDALIQKRDELHDTTISLQIKINNLNEELGRLNKPHPELEKLRKQNKSLDLLFSNKAHYFVDDSYRIGNLDDSTYNNHWRLISFGGKSTEDRKVEPTSGILWLGSYGDDSGYKTYIRDVFETINGAFEYLLKSEKISDINLVNAYTQYKNELSIEFNETYADAINKIKDECKKRELASIDHDIDEIKKSIKLRFNIAEGDEQYPLVKQLIDGIRFKEENAIKAP